MPLHKTNVLYTGRQELSTVMNAGEPAVTSRAGSDEEHTIFIAFASGRSIERVLQIDFDGAEPHVHASTVRAIRLRIGDADVAEPTAALSPAGAAPRGGATWICGRLTVDLDDHRVFLDSTPIYLTAMEMRLLVYLVERKDRLCRLRDILDNVWGTVGDTSRRTLNTHVNRLRVKLAGAGVRVETIRGVGLRLTEERPSRQLSAAPPDGAISRRGGAAQLTPLLPRAPAKAGVSPRPL